MMAAADCGMCEAMGYRSCDVCGNPVFPGNLKESTAGRELCGYCLPSVGR